MIALPTVVFLGGARLMTYLSGRAIVTSQLESLPVKADRTPLNSRFRGYDLKAVARHWSALNPDALAAETRFLEMDLVFPLLYGGALLVALLLGWAALGRSFNPALLVLAVAVTVLADWTENLTLLGQLEAVPRTLVSTPIADRVAPVAAALSAGRVTLASTATLVKLTGVVVMDLTAIVLIVQMIRKAP